MSPFRVTVAHRYWRAQYTNSRFNAIAVGHHSGGPTGAEIFNDIDLVEDALNVDVISVP